MDAYGKVQVAVKASIVSSFTFAIDLINIINIHQYCQYFILVNCVYIILYHQILLLFYLLPQNHIVTITMPSALQLFQSINRKLGTLDPQSKTILFFGYTDSTPKILNFLKEAHSSKQATDTSSVLESLYLQHQQITIINLPNDTTIDREIQEFIGSYLVYTLINRWNLLNICLEVSFEATIQQEEFKEFLDQTTKYFSGIDLDKIQKATSLIFTKIEFPEDADQITQFLQALADNYKEVRPIYINAIQNQHYSLFLNDDDPQNSSLTKQLSQISSYHSLSVKQASLLVPFSSKLPQPDINEICQLIVAESISFLSLYCFQLLYELTISTENIEYVLESILKKLDKKEINHKYPHQFYVNGEEYFQYIIEIFLESDQISKATKCGTLTQRMIGLLAFINKQIEGCSLPEYLKSALKKERDKFDSQLKFIGIVMLPGSIDIENCKIIKTWASEIQNKIIRIINSSEALKNVCNDQTNPKIQQIFDKIGKVVCQDQDDQDSNLVKRFYSYVIADYQSDIPLPLKKDIQRDLYQITRPMLEKIIDVENYNNPKCIQKEIIDIFEIVYSCRELETAILILLACNSLEGISKMLPQYLQYNYQDGYNSIIRKHNLLSSKLFSYFSERMKEPRKSQKSLECLLRCLNFMESTALDTQQFEKYEDIAKKYMLRTLKLEGMNVFQFRKRYNENQQPSVFCKIISGIEVNNQKSFLKQSNPTINLSHLQQIDMQYCLGVIRSHRLFEKTENNHKILQLMKDQDKKV